MSDPFVISSESPGNRRWPGGAVGGRDLVFTYQLMTDQLARDGRPRAFARFASSAEGWAQATPVLVADQTAYDPAAVRAKDGTLFVLFADGDVIWSARGTNGSFDPPLAAVPSGPGHNMEVTARRVAGAVVVAYCFREAGTTKDAPGILRIGELDAGSGLVTDRTEIASVTVNAQSVMPCGQGVSGSQRRVGIAGDKRQALLAFCPDQGPQATRPLFVATVDITTWTVSDVQQIAALPGVDMFNPFAVRVGNEMQVYVALNPSNRIGLSRKPDGGSWGPLEQIRRPDGWRSGRVVGLVDNGLVLVGSGTRDDTLLGWRQ